MTQQRCPAHLSYPRTDHGPHTGVAAWASAVKSCWHHRRPSQRPAMIPKTPWRPLRALVHARARHSGKRTTGANLARSPSWRSLNRHTTLASAFRRALPSVLPGLRSPARPGLSTRVDLGTAPDRSSLTIPAVGFATPAVACKRPEARPRAPTRGRAISCCLGLIPPVHRRASQGGPSLDTAPAHHG